MSRLAKGAALLALLVAAGTAQAAEGIGKIKTMSGQVSVERDGKAMPAKLGDTVYQTDKITTGADGSVGMLFNDDSRVSAGPNSVLSLDKFAYDTTTHDGGFDVSMKKGTLSVISGKLTEKTPGALKVKTPAAILAVRGTEFSVKVDEAGGQQ
jgi:hypothetical protein